MNHRRRPPLLLAMLLAACADDLPKATEIARMRVLGAKLEVMDDEARTTPAPGEAVRVSLSTVFPSLAADRSAMQSLIITCTAPDRYTGGIPICQELIESASAPGASPADIELPEGFPDRFACSSSLAFPPIGPLSLHCKKGEPSFQLGIPDDYEADELLFVGILCERGSAVLDPELPGLFGCEDESADVIPLHGLVRVQHDAKDENHNPDMRALRMVREISGAWEPVDPALLVPDNEMCFPVVDRAPDDPKLPWIIGSMDFRLRYAADAREPDEDGEPETIEITVHATAGEVERRFTLFEPDDDVDEEGNLHDSLRWKSPALEEVTLKRADPDAGRPEDEGSNGKLVRFFVTVRDGRGGFGQADYALCAVGKDPGRR